MDVNNCSIPFNPQPRKFKSLVGQIFTRLTVISLWGHSADGKRNYWLCRCECGKFVVIESSKMRSGNTQSCGCLRSERISARRTSHGASTTTEYKSYNTAWHRCNNPKMTGYSYYGGRGIEFRFTSFQEFLDHVGLKPSPTHSIDRIDPDGHYEIGNVKWSTKKEQSINTRRKRLLTVYGETKRIGEWAEQTGLTRSALEYRQEQGYCDDCILSPIKGLGCAHRVTSLELVLH